MLHKWSVKWLGHQSRVVMKERGCCALPEDHNNLLKAGPWARLVRMVLGKY